MTPFDLLRLDRDVAAISARVRAWRRAGRIEEPPAIPRELSSLATYRDLKDLASDPIAGRLALHVASLTLDRVTVDDELRVSEARRARSESPAAPGVSIAQLAHQIVEPGNAKARLRELEAIARPLREAVRIAAGRRHEAALRLGLSSAYEIEGAAIPPVAVLVDEALGITEPAFAEMRGASFLELVQMGVAADAGEGWPAKITSRWLRSVFGRGPLFDGLSLAVEPLPEPLGAASFARALARTGAELAYADRPTDVPASVARDPFDLLEASRAVLFGALVAEPAFHTRKLGLGPGRARDQARVVARRAVIWLRVAALRALAYADLGEVDRSGNYPEHVERCLGRPLSGELAGVMPLASPSSALHLAAFFRAAQDREALREAFDEDWFDNPRAHEALRHENHTSRPVRPEKAEATENVGSADPKGSLRRALAELLP
ncbi:MAG: hypothetical protein HOV80_20915 [Polyangiaceae bacterium]|nr:hypothetical protein [Polyangiaceae bacterium]